jgi:hypothetical protein
MVISLTTQCGFIAKMKGAVYFLQGLPVMSREYFTVQRSSTPHIATGFMILRIGYLVYVLLLHERELRRNPRGVVDRVELHAIDR